MIKRLATLALLPLALSGCAGSAALSGKISNLEGALQNGGTLTPVTNLANTYLLQEYQDIHNLMVALQQVSQSQGMVAITVPPPIVVPSQSPTVVMPKTPVMVVPTVPPVTMTNPTPAPPPAQPPVVTPSEPTSPIVTPTARVRRIHPSAFFRQHPPTFKLVSGPLGLGAARLEGRTF